MTGEASVSSELGWVDGNLRDRALETCALEPRLTSTTPEDRTIDEDEHLGK